MFARNGTRELEKWLINPDRKPLILRGARQVGKTTLVLEFAKRFEQFIHLNLDLPADRVPFEKFDSIETLIQAIFFLKNFTLDKRNQTLIFIDEIQEVPEAVNMLRYFYESAPDIPVIAAGSMLESLFDKNISYPVGRVEYKVIRPVSFPEFLAAMGETRALEQLGNIPIASFAHEKLLRLFHTYALIGGMPEIVRHYADHKDLAALSPIYDALITSYLEDVEKYASGDAQILHIRHVIRTSFAEAGKRIKFEGFGNAAYKSREMGESLRIAEKALLLHLIFPVTSAILPLMPDMKKSPRLQVLDTGMLNYFVGIQKNILHSDNLSDIYEGTMIEHLMGQEILAGQYLSLSALNFWVREKNTSSAEIDYIYPFDGMLIPIEVKSGAAGRLKSLHQYMDLAPHTMAIRFYADELKWTDAVTPSGKKYRLLNLPYYLVSQLEKYLDWFQKNNGGEKHVTDLGSPEITTPSSPP